MCLSDFLLKPANPYRPFPSNISDGYSQRRIFIDKKRKQRVENKIEDIDKLLDESILFIDEDHRENLIRMVRQELDKLSSILKVGNVVDNLLHKYERVNQNLNN